MSAQRPPAEPARWPAGAVPALLVLALGLAVVLARPPLPVDETRYLEVFRETLQGNPLLLRLLGEPYAEKPPLLFWLARGLTWLGLPRDFSLRLVPALATALTLLFAARLGVRAGLSLAGWVLAALWLPALAGQFLLFDPLLSLAVWGAVDAWTRGRALPLGLWSAAALLAKGPVAYLLLLPFLWGTSRLREPRAGDLGRAGIALTAALVPLAAWALAAASAGGPAFASALLWERWAGRVAGSEHARPLYFYVPVVLLGALPATPLLIRRDEPHAPAWSRRLASSLLLVLAAFTLIRGKQAHYLVPAAPALALIVARRIEGDARALARLRGGVLAQLGLLACLAALGLWWIPGQTGSLGTRGRALLASDVWRVPLLLALAAALAGLVLARRAASPRALLAGAVACVGACVLPLHFLAGELLFPHELAHALHDTPEHVARLGTAHHGLYALLASRDDIEKLQDDSELAAWARLHPDGMLLVDPKALKRDLPGDLELLASDVVHRFTVWVLRSRQGGHAPPAPSVRLRRGARRSQSPRLWRSCSSSAARARFSASSSL